MCILAWVLVRENIRDRRIKHMKKVKQTNQTVQNSSSYDAQLNQDRTCALQLYEKGILSADSLLEKMGYDPKQETDRRKNEKGHVSNGYNENPSWSIVSNRVEQARRNVEMISKVLTIDAFKESDNNTGYTLLLETMLENLKILNETKNIK